MARSPGSRKVPEEGEVMPKIFSGPNPQTFLKLEESEGEVVLTMVDAKGEPISRGKILRICENGRLHLYPNINAEQAEYAGIRLNTNGEILRS